MTTWRTHRLVVGCVALSGLGSLQGCTTGRAPSHQTSPDPGATSASGDDRLAALRAYERQRRERADFAQMPTSDTTMGPNPQRVLGLLNSGRVAGLLRGGHAVVLLDERWHEIARADAPASPTGLAVDDRGDLFVTGELSSRIIRYSAGAHALVPTGFLDLDGVKAIRDVAAGPGGILYVVEEHDGRLITLRVRRGAPHTRSPEGAEARLDYDRSESFVGNGPFRVHRVGPFLIVNCLLDHALVVRRLDPMGIPAAEDEARIVHDGPLWSFAARESPRGLLVAAGGVENHPLDRRQGSFGFIDSFVYLYAIPGGGSAPVLLSEVNVSALGVITPKALALETDTHGGVAVTVTGYGGDRSARLSWDDDMGRAPTVDVAPFPPGTTDFIARPDGKLLAANPLLDAWVESGSPATVIPVREDVTAAAAPEEASTDNGALRRAMKIGEALFFTKLMAPWNHTEGALSRFTCETCHFEGYVDGRTHHTGRGDVHATTKPLLGLFNNRPHFSRALDPDLTSVADNEFVVAGMKSDKDPWFSARLAEFPWLLHLGVTEAEVAPVELRKSLMSFLMSFTHRPNPAVLGRSAFTEEERRGAELFRDRCERCHAARLASDDESTRVPFGNWESHVFSPRGEIVWGRDSYYRTGVTPYVHELGARAPSLRRLYKKRPYFTNGSAKDLASLLARARFSNGDVFYHDAAPSEALDQLDARERRSLLAFLDLL